MMTRHADLLRAMGEFYTLLGQLGTIDTSLVKIPVLPNSLAPINKTAALAAGFTEEVVGLMEQLPYLAVGLGAWDPEIMPSTEAIDLTAYDDEGAFEGLRVYDDDQMNGENLIPGSSLKLTTQNIYGTTLIYDTKTCLMTEWKSFDNPQDVYGYAHVAAKPPSEVMAPWIEAYRSFKYIYTPEGSRWHKDLDMQTVPPTHYSLKERKMWLLSQATAQALWKLEDIYLQCGWDPNSKEQESFDREQFLQRRQEYLREVVQPLLDKEEQLRNRIMSGDDELEEDEAQHEEL